MLAIFKQNYFIECRLKVKETNFVLIKIRHNINLSFKRGICGIMAHKCHLTFSIPFL